MSKLIKKVALIGGGVIGGGWAARLVLNGVDVKVFDPSDTAERNSKGNAVPMPELSLFKTNNGSVGEAGQN